MRKPAAFALVIALALAGCTEATTKDQPDDASKAKPDATKTASKATTPKPRKARIGDSITISGLEGEKIRVKLLRVRDPVQPSEFETPAKGKRYVGIEVQFTNVGEKTYSDSPGNGAVLIYGADRETNPTIIVQGDCTSDFASQTKIAPGGKRRGCIPFEVPEKSKLRMFQLALTSGFADENGEWLLRK